MSKDLLLSEVRIPPISKAMGRIVAKCGDENFSFALHIDDFRIAIASAQQAIDEFDASHEVVRLRG